MRLKPGFLAALPALLLIPLAILASLQFSAIDDIEGRERSRLRQTLGTAAAGLAEAIEEELFVIPSGFRLGDKELESRDWSALRDQVEAWKAYALAPDAIAAIALLGGGKGVEVWNGQSFVPATGNALTDLSAREAARAAAGIGQGETPPWTLLKLSGNLDAIVVAAGRADSGRRLAVVVDRRVVVDRLVPLLAERHLYGTGEYRFRVIDRNGSDRIVYASDPKAPESSFANPDLEAPLVLELSDLVEHDRVIYIRRDSASEGNSLFARTTIARVLSARRQAQAGKGSGPVPARRDGLILQAVHREGSLAAALQASRRRSIAVSAGVLGILGAGIAFLAFGMARARLLADRQREFIAAVSHELKTPIAVIRSASENLEDGVVSGEDRVRAYGSAIKQESSRLGDLIDRLLRFARLSSGKRAGIVEPVDLRELVQEVAASCLADFHAARFRVEIALGEEEALAAVDRSALAVALRNLVENVLRHASDGRYLGLRVLAEPFPEASPRGRSRRARRPKVSIRVIDRGPGIPRRERRGIFSPFFRGERARRLQVPGSGIGLGLAQKIVEADGGRMRLESKVGFGSEFEVSFPRVRRTGAAGGSR